MCWLQTFVPICAKSGKLIVPADVLAFRTRPHHSPDFLYSVLLQDVFFDHAMAGKKGAKMPRGDKNQIMRYLVPDISKDEELRIGHLIASISQKIRINRQLNDNLLPADDRGITEAE